MAVNDDVLEARAADLGAALIRHAWRLATAESCTGGWLAQVLTSVAGSSAWFDRGFVTYSNTAKQDMLGVQSETLTQYGAVSEETAREMVEGALKRSQAQIAISITGIAGPSGGTLEKPVGTVCFAWGLSGQSAMSTIQYFAGDRKHIRADAVGFALQQLRRLLP